MQHVENFLTAQPKSLLHISFHNVSNCVLQCFQNAFCQRWATVVQPRISIWTFSTNRIGIDPTLPDLTIQFYILL